MNVLKSSKPRCFAFTLIELLVVVVIIVVLAGLLLPSTNHPRIKAKIQTARMDMRSLQAAISSYETMYSRLPIADSDTNSDVTYGISSADIHGLQKISGTQLIVSNSDVLIVLMEIDSGVNAGHKMNPQKTILIDPKRVNDAKSPGVSIVDYQFRDPWGNPYIISLDRNGDNCLRDVCYASPTMSAVGVNSLVKTNGVYEWNGRVMIWSRGPDGKVSADDKANAGVNKDNVLGWQ